MPRALRTLPAVLLIATAGLLAGCSDDDGGDGGPGAESLREALMAEGAGADEEQADCVIDSLEEDGVSDEAMGDLAENLDTPPEDADVATAFIDAATSCVPED